MQSERTSIGLRCNEQSWRLSASTDPRRSLWLTKSQTLENIVTSRLVVTVLLTLIALKFVHLKIQQKYEWIEHASILPSCKIWDATEICNEKQKREISLWIVVGYGFGMNSWTRNYLSARFFFCLFLHRFLFSLKLFMIVDDYRLYPFKFLNKFFMHKFRCN